MPAVRYPRSHSDVGTPSTLRLRFTSAATFSAMACCVMGMPGNATCAL